VGQQRLGVDFAALVEIASVERVQLILFLFTALPLKCNATVAGLKLLTLQKRWYQGIMAP
jgi:hypothetical protein